MSARRPELVRRPERARRRVGILGATGSVGLATAAVIEAANADPDAALTFDVAFVAAGSNGAALAQVARRLGARRAVLCDPNGLAALREGLGGSGILAEAGPDALEAAASERVDAVMAAIVGVAGLAPALAAARAGSAVLLANKEALVSAGALFLAAMRAGGGALLPVDSEHSAVFQVLDPARAHAVERITITASGGPFRDWPLERMAAARPEDALKHPTWSMGAKISIDSATMFNKGLELIEAARLFAMPADRIEALVHPQSVVHALVAYYDGSVLAQLGAPDMRTPIATALAWPDRMPTGVARLDLTAIGRLDFLAPDPTRFPALRLARAALEAGGSACAALNAANEAAVAAFLAREIGFLDIARLVEMVVERMGARAGGGEPDDLATVMAIDAEARARLREGVTARV